MSDLNHDIDLGSLESDYIHFCVRFTQKHGLHPTSSGQYPDISLLDDSPCPLLNPGYQKTNFALNHQDTDPSESSGQCPGPNVSSTFADTYYPQHGYDHENDLSPYMETTATHQNYSQHDDDLSNDNFSIADDVISISDDNEINVSPDQFPVLRENPQHWASDPFAYDPATQSLSDNLRSTPAQTSPFDDLRSTPAPDSPSDNLHSTPAPAKLPRKVKLARKALQVVPLSSANEIGDRGLAALHSYDPLWAQNAGADRNSVLAYRSKMKFEQVFLDGVLRIGDRLVIGYSSVFSENFDNEVATLTVCEISSPDDAFTHLFSVLTNNYRVCKQHTGFSKPKPLPTNHSTRFFPDFILTLSSHPLYTQPVLACNGNNAILKEFDKIRISGPEISSSLAGNLQVWRGGQHLGNFAFVRQAWHTWKNRMDAQTQGKGKSWRRRKGDSRSAVGVGRRSGREKAA